jgi:hypothetical protein
LIGRPITIIKDDHTGREVWRYQGVVIAETVSSITVEAFFNREDRDDGYILWRRGDRFVEHFYTDRWYNIFEIHDVEDDHIKGWYCNLARPALIEDDQVVQDDLALDVFIDPDGQVLVQDEDEFEELPLSLEERAQVRDALAALRQMIIQGDVPFSR